MKVKLVSTTRSLVQEAEMTAEELIVYIARAGKKTPTKHLEDLEKAKWYLEREIANVKSEFSM